MDGTIGRVISALLPLAAVTLSLWAGTASGQSHSVPYFSAASDANRQGFVRVVILPMWREVAAVPHEMLRDFSPLRDAGVPSAAVPRPGPTRSGDAHTVERRSSPSSGENRSHRTEFRAKGRLRQYSRSASPKQIGLDNVARIVVDLPPGAELGPQVSLRLHLYERTRINTSRGERWFCSETGARAAG